MLEMLLVGAIVLVATLYSTWALLPRAARQRLAGRLLPLASSGWCPDWLRRRIQSAAARTGPGSPCDNCGVSEPRDDASR
jgi:hypothetical protein